MYGVVRCSRCGRAQGVRLEAKTRQCACGHRVDLTAARPLFTTEDPRELPAALGRIRADRTGQLEAYDETLKAEDLEALTPGGSGLPARVRRERGLEVLATLSRDPEGFALDRAREVLDSLGLDGGDLLEALRRENLLYEVAPGRYRLV